MSTQETIICPQCNSKLYIIEDKKNFTWVECAACKHCFRYSTAIKFTTDAAPVNTPTPAASKKPSGSNQKAAPVHKAQTPTRTVTIQRLMHAHKDLTGSGIQNMLKDSMPVMIYLDGTKQGTLAKDQPFVLHLDSNAHTISHTPISSKSIIPAGNNDYVAYFFNTSFMIGPVHDPFRDELTQWVLNMVRGQGFRDRIQDPNNHYHAVKVSIQSNCIRVHWAVNQKKGFTEWSSGEKEEKIYYNQIGLTPPPSNRQPGGYWQYLGNFVQQSVKNDPQADLVHGIGGFSFRKTHGLY